ncbi:hypothetical protein PoB_001646900 [Plakobranchus ocellatus]|uniref:DDE Tnp4 domain-containing protein n=1 Tax=Plakobranchus ocellatus TaxID=259542 RepID=A0AAV3Z7K0_9GAST|nr:hypothetical protein PoB_001646900 [Plakobranchus ocellatus]
MAFKTARSETWTWDRAWLNTCPVAMSFWEGKLLIERKLHLPAPIRIPQTQQLIPPVFVADEAFPLLINLMKPFPRRNLTFEQRVFNYRLSRARRHVECSFGVLSNTWRILLKSIETNTVTAIEYVKAVCVLHNFLLAHEPERMKTPDSQYEYSSMDRDDTVLASTRTASQAAKCNSEQTP